MLTNSLVLHVLFCACRRKPVEENGTSRRWPTVSTNVPNAVVAKVDMPITIETPHVMLRKSPAGRQIVARASSLTKSNISSASRSFTDLDSSSDLKRRDWSWDSSEALIRHPGEPQSKLPRQFSPVHVKAESLDESRCKEELREVPKDYFLCRGQSFDVPAGLVRSLHPRLH
eukprot:TRINITY_DN6190_c0_g1_i1.p1 TRINITY_DN6190_c0_g1~~TRINITY_DN6190_c0_g1_i1.p1  ORF type:complete len:172 (-),score=9.14 TRINITY_DN6190_c0_g1_i1:152-667(-)